MRPVDKGEAPDIEFRHYQEAEPYLEERLGKYCSYCEFPVFHVPEVEHKESRSKGGDTLSWGNLLLSCKYCNTRKGAIVAKGDGDNYLWPDVDDTFHPFSYQDDIPKLDEEYLRSQGSDVKQKAENLFRLVKLDHVPTKLTEKDRRYFSRNNTRNYALESKAGWDSVKHSADKNLYMEQIKMLAESSGFFSVWMQVFKDDPEVKEMLVSAFKGTKREFCLA